MKNFFSFLTMLLCSMLFTGQIWATDYDLYVAGIQVTDANANNISGTGISGKVSYDPTTNTLTLENASIVSSGSNHCILNRIGNLKIKLTGNNTCTYSGAPILSGFDFSIIGNGSLVATSTKDCGIYASGCNLTIENATVTAIGDYGIAGKDGSCEILTIKNAVVKATGSLGSICDFKEIKLEGCAITKPSGAVVDGGAVKLSGDVVTNEVVIEPKQTGPVTKYGLYVAGIQVTSANASNISDTDITGKVSYDSTANTLTLENASIVSSGSNICIFNKIGNLKIKLIGNNTCTCSGSGSTIQSEADFSIIGNGSLVATSTLDCGIYATGCNLTIENATVTTTGDYGIAGKDGDCEILTIKNAVVKATGKFGSIRDFKEIKLEGCAITKPSGAVVDGGAVKLSGDVVTNEVVIEPVSEGVREILANNVKIRMQNRQMTVENNARESIAVYNVMGQIIDIRHNPDETETFILPAGGVYFVKVGKCSTKIITR